MAGRPTAYTKKLADTICDKLVAGDSLHTICDSPKMPHRSTVLRWAAKHEAFRDQYAHAMQARADGKFEELENLALSATPESVQVVKLHIDTLKWTIERQNPKKYGTHSSIDLGSDPDRPVQHQLDATAVVDAMKDVIAKL